MSCLFGYKRGIPVQNSRISLKNKKYQLTQRVISTQDAIPHQTVVINHESKISNIRQSKIESKKRIQVQYQFLNHNQDDLKLQGTRLSKMDVGIRSKYYIENLEGESQFNDDNGDDIKATRFQDVNLLTYKTKQDDLDCETQPINMKKFIYGLQAKKIQ